MRCRHGHAKKMVAYKVLPGGQQLPSAFCVVLQVEFDEDVKTGHSYANKVASEGVAPRSRQARIGKELAGLAASLPLTLSSSVFVRVDQTHMTLWKALITGWASFLDVCRVHILQNEAKNDSELCDTGLAVYLEALLNISRDADL